MWETCHMYILLWNVHIFDPNRSYVCPFLLFDLEFWNSSVWFALPSNFLDLIFSWHTVLVKLYFLLRNPSKMSPHDTLHFWRHLLIFGDTYGGLVISAGDPKGPNQVKSGEFANILSLASSETDINASLFASKITLPSGLFVPESEILSPSVPLHCTLFITVL